MDRPPLHPFEARNHQVMLSARGLTRSLVECLADLANDPNVQGRMINGVNTLGVAQTLSKAYGITARSAVADLGIPIPQFRVMLGETATHVSEPGAAIHQPALVNEGDI